MENPTAALIDQVCSPDPAVVVAALQAAAEPQRWTGTGENPSPVFLCYLAAEWKLTEAHPLVVALLRSPPKDCDAVLGDFITGGARLVLADTWPGNLRGIEALAFDERAARLCRSTRRARATSHSPTKSSPPHST